MEITEFKKSLLLKLYLKGLMKTPYMYHYERKNYNAHRNSLYTLSTLLFNRPHKGSTFDCLNKQAENDFVKSNIKIYNAYESYNKLIKDIDISDINLEEVYKAIRESKVKEDITYEEMMELTNEYYNSLPDKEIRNSFNHIYKEKDKNINFNDEYSYSLLLPSIDYCLISLDISNEYYKEMIYDLIHEYGHCIQTDLNKKIDFYGEDYKPIELMPIFFNMLSTFYFDDTKTNNTYEKNIILMQTNMFINQIKYTEEIMQIGLEEFKKKYNDTSINIYFEYNMLQVYSYLIPMLTSFELLTKYKENPEKAFYLLKQLIKAEDDSNYLEELKKNEINLGENSKEVIKMLKK